MNTPYIETAVAISEATSNTTRVAMGVVTDVALTTIVKIDFSIDVAAAIVDGTWTATAIATTAATAEATLWP